MCPRFCVFMVIFLVVWKTANTQHSRGVVKQFNDVPLQHYGDPCEPFSPRMPDFRAPGRRISEVKCFEYVWQAKLAMQNIAQKSDCKRKPFEQIPTVFGGRDARLGEYSHMGAIGWKGLTGDWIFKCGASLISEKFALTAAHCSKLKREDTDVSDLVPRIVRIGAVTIQNLAYKRLPATDAHIIRIIVHPQYKPPQQYFDIALMQFQDEVKFDWLAHPSCLESLFEDPEKANVAGWGVVDLATLTTSPELQVADVNIIKSGNCNSLLRSKFNRNWRGVADNQLCAGHLAGGIDTCQGDSGGPLSYMIPNNRHKEDTDRWSMHRIIGVTSFGYGCGRANSPGVYTRVASFIDWIESIVWPTNFYY